LLAYIQKSLTEADGAMAARAQREPVPTERLSTKVRPAFGQLEENRTLTNLIVNHGLSGLLGDDNCFDIVRVRPNPKPTDLDSLKTLFGGSPGQLANPGPNILYDLLSDDVWQSYKVYEMVTCSGDDFTVSIFPDGTSLSDMRDGYGDQINLLDPGTSWKLDLRLAAEDPDYIEGLELSGDGNHKLIVTFQTLREPPHSHRELESELLKVGDSLLWMEYDDDEDLSSWPEASQLSSILLGGDGEFERILYHRDT